MAFNLIAVIGPTATGKTSFAAHLAGHAGGEIISADSRQVYRRMNLGTGKDYGDYMVHGTPFPVHLIDICEPGHKYSVYEYQRDFFNAFTGITSRGKLPVLCGGSGMYIQAALKGYKLVEVPWDPVLRKSLMNKDLTELKQMLVSRKTPHNVSDFDSPERAIRAIEIENFYRNASPVPDLPRINPLIIGLAYERAGERARITERLQARLRLGLVEEVKQLMESGIPAETLLYYGLEYKYVTMYLQGELDYPGMFSLLNTAIHQFAKRQRTWFRKMERDGAVIHWIKGELPLEKKLEIALNLMASQD